MDNVMVAEAGNDEDHNVLALPDGSELSHMQATACTLKATTTYPLSRIAKEAGYTTRQSLKRFLVSDKGQAGVRVALQGHIEDLGILGLNTLRTLAKSARSERTRYDASAKLVDISKVQNVVAEPQQQSVGGGREVSINISLGNTGTGLEHGLVTRDVSPVVDGSVEE